MPSMLFDHPDNFQPEKLTSLQSASTWVFTFIDNLLAHYHVCLWFRSPHFSHKVLVMVITISLFADFLRTSLQQTVCSGKYHNRYTVTKLVNTYKSHVFSSCNMHEYTDICKVLIKIWYKVSPIATLMCGSPSLMQLGLIFAVVRDKSTVKISFSNFVPHCSFITLL